MSWHGSVEVEDCAVLSAIEILKLRLTFCSLFRRFLVGSYYTRLYGIQSKLPMRTTRLSDLVFLSGQYSFHLFLHAAFQFRIF